MDTQWPRYEVFKQDAPGQPYQNVGTVHASDAEMALLNARDIFGRRPSCHSLWVAPEQAILKATAEELADPEKYSLLVSAGAPTAPIATFRVFVKNTQKRSMIFVTFVGEVEAGSAQQALALALKQFVQAEGWVWWVCPAQAILESEPGIEESWFAPANDKVYRQQSYYGRVKRKRLDERLQIAQELDQSAKPASRKEVVQ